MSKCTHEGIGLPGCDVCDPRAKPVKCIFCDGEDVHECPGGAFDACKPHSNLDDRAFVLNCARCGLDSHNGLKGSAAYEVMKRAGCVLEDEEPRGGFEFL